MTIDRLLGMLDVRVHAFALCVVSRGTGLRLLGHKLVLLHYILRGHGALRTENGTTVEFGPGTLIVLPPEQPHDIFDQDGAPTFFEAKDLATPWGDGTLRIATAGPEPSILTACSTISAEYGGLDLFGKLREPIVEDLSGDSTVRSAFDRMLNELESPRFGTRSLTEALMKPCLIVALSKQVESGRASFLPVLGFDEPRVLQALETMMKDPARDHSLEDLARRSGMSRALFARRFAEAFGSPPMELLKQIRLHRSAQLLRSTSLPVQMVALAVGYTSRTYFSRAFKAAYGADPKTFREQSHLSRETAKEQ